MADKLLKSIKFPTLPDRYVIGDSTLSEEGAAADAKAVGEALATKADTKGTYEDLIVGGAEQLMSDEYETDKEPYLFRPTGGSADVGNREYLDKIVGGTVAWNQLVQCGNFDSSTLTTYWSAKNLSASNNVATFTVSSDFQSLVGSTRNFRFSGTPNAHKYLVSVDIKLTSASADVVVRLNGGYWQKSVSSTTNWQTVSGIYSWDTSDNGYIQVIDRRNSDWDAISVRNFMIFDLTQMFGTTIADYIYSLEQASAGAGVAWVRQYFPKDYYPYDPGTLRSVEGVSAHETVGLNQWDEEWELGGIDSSGNTSANTDRIRSKNFVPILPNIDYYFKVSSAWRIFYYDANMNFISYIGTYSASRLITTPDNAHYLKFYCVGTTYNHDICINISDPTRNGEYEPYQKHTYPLDSSLTLRGVPKLVDGKLAYDGDVYLPSGEVQRRYGIVDLGTLNWAYYSDYQMFYAAISGKKAGTGNLLCSKYRTTDAIFTVANDKACGGNGSNGTTYIRDTSFGTDSTAFKTAMSGVYLVYELATPTTETADGYEHYQICDPSGTEEFVTTGIVPVGHETRYPHDLKKKIETAPDSPSTDGTYLMKRSGGKNTYMALPSTPSANGAYVLTVTVSGGSASYSWAAKE